MQKLTIERLIDEAYAFCEYESQLNHSSLIGVTDGKAVGTYVEHKFKEYLANNYLLGKGNSAKGIDLPDEHINTDIKVTSIRQPQSSSPFKSARQKIFGLGYNLLVFVYDKYDTKNSSTLDFKFLTFVEAPRTADYTVTMRIGEMLRDGANRDDIIGFFIDKNIPGDEIIYNDLADEIFSSPPEQGFLTISNALQWRLQYGRVILLNNEVEGVVNHEWR